MIFDFDTPIKREQTASLKYDGREAYFGKDDVIPLWVADMDFAAPEAVTNALIERAQHPVYGYSLYPDTLYTGIQDWFQKRHNWQIERNQIVMCPGVVPTLHAAVEALTDPGDKVIIQPPVYHPFFSVVKKAQRELVLNPLKLEGDAYKMDLHHLEQCAAEGAKALLLCSPHNPVGRVWSKQELIDLLTIAKKYQLMIVSDEIHADLIFPDETHIPLTTLTSEVSIITTISASKSFNIPGLGLSAMVVKDKTQRKAIKNVFERWHISTENPFSIVGFETAYREGEAWLDALMQYVLKTKQQVSEFAFLHWQHIQIMPSQGTYLLWIDCRELDMEDKAMREFFIEKAKVGMNAGFTFGNAGSGFMRMNIAAPRRDILTACQRIADAL